MDPDFWHEKWKNKEIGFHQDDFNPDLVNYFPHLNIRKRGNIFVPLCGKTKDLLWLYNQGYKVTGVEISPVAVMEFFQENDILYNIKLSTHHQCFETTDGRLSLFCGDIFDFEKECNLPPFHAVFDRAALVALPPDKRVAYTNLIKKLAPTASLLLVAFEYDQDQMAGPPFSVTEQEIREHFKDNEIQLLHDEMVVADGARFKEAGLTEFCKKTYLIR